MPLSPDEIRNVYNNEDEATATELMAGDREDVKNFNENVVSPSKTFNALSQNVLFAPFTNGTHKSFDVLENAYVPAERSLSKDFSRSMIKDELNERRNKLITEANKESDPALKESMQMEAADITKRLSYLSSLPETENLDAFASILRGIKRSAPSFAAGTAASLATGGSSLVGVGVTALGNFFANKELNYNEAYAGALDSGVNLSAEELDERATKSMYVMSLLDGLDAATGIGGGALKIAREWGKSAISREFRSELKKKLAKETLLKAAGSVAKSAAKEAAIEGATEVVQDKSRERIMRGEGAISSMGYAVGDFVGAIGRTIAGTATPEDKETIKTFRSVFFASLVFSGVMNSANKFAPRIYSAVKQNKVEKGDRVYFDNMKKIGLVQPAVDIVDDVMDTNNKRPEYRYADAKKLQTVLEEDLQREDLSDAQRTREEDLLRRSIEAQKTTGQVELTAKEHANTFLDPLNETLFQKTNKQTFFVDPESIYEDYSLEQLTLQAVEEIDKEALSEGSAFMDVYNVLKESGQAADSELIANSLQHHALLTTAATAQEKTYSDLKKEYNLGLKIDSDATGTGLNMFAGFASNMSEPVKKSFFEAKSLEKSGAKREDIYEKTGWFRGTDGKWRYEISDKDAKLKLGFTSGTLESVLDHKKLFEAYPEVKDILVVYSDSFDSAGGAVKGFLVVSKGLSEKEKIKVLLHEVQHYIQKKENFSRGGNPSQFEHLSPIAYDEMETFGAALARFAQKNDKLKYIVEPDSFDPLELFEHERDFDFVKDEIINVDGVDISIGEAFDYFKTAFLKTSYGQYAALGGEVEARNTENRSELSSEERRKSFPLETIDIPEENVTSLFNSDSVDVPEPVEPVESKIKNEQIENDTSKEPDVVSTEQTEDGFAIVQPDVGKEDSLIAGEVSRTANDIMITLTKASNPTTFSHESFHLFELIMGDAFKAGKLTPYWAKQMQKLYKAAGIDDLTAFYKGELGGNVRIERAMKSEAARKQREAKLAAKALARDEEKSDRDFEKFLGEALKGREKEIRYSLKEINTKVENAIVKSVLKAAKRFSENGYKEYKKAPKTRLQYIKDYLSANGYRGIADNRESTDKTIDAFGGSSTELFIPEELSEYSKLGAQKKGAKPVHYDTLIEELVQSGELQDGATLNDLTEWLSHSDTPLIGEEGERTKSSLVGEAYEHMTRDADVKANEKSVREFVRSKIKEANEGLGYFANEAIDKLIAKETEEVRRVYNELRANGISSVVAYEDAIMEARGFIPDPDAKLKYYQGKPAETLYGDVQERLAEAWTEYLQTGESPKKAYETMFAKFKELFAPIYKNFVRQGALNKSIREVYDRIFLSYEEAKEVARERRIGLINRPAGVDDETWGKYTAAKKMAIARSSDGIVKAIRELSQMKNDAEYQAELAKVRERLEAELANDKQFQMQDYLLTKDAPKIKTSEVSGLDVGWYNKKMTAKDGMTLDEAVDFLNMQFDGSIDASDLLGILTGPTREQYIDMQADRAMNAWMRGRYPELFARISAESTMNNMSAIDAVLYEYMFLSNDTGMKINKEAFGDIKVMFERAVEKTLEETPVKRMSSDKYKKMLLGNALKQRAAGESKAKLAELKYQQAILMRLAELSADVEKDVNSLVKMSQKYKKSLDDSKQRSAIDADSRELIRSIFNDAGVSKMSLRQGEVSTIDKLANWVSEYGNKQYRNENDIDIYSELVPLLQKVEGIGYKNLNASELKSLKDGLMFIKNVSEESRLEKMRDIVAERDADATEFAAQLAERGFKQDVSEWTKHKLKMVSVPILLKSVLPESLHQKYLRPFFNGIIASNNAKKADFERIAEIFGDEVNRLNDKFVYNGIVMTRENLLVMMLNTGTVHNVRTLATTMLHNADRWGLQVKNKNRFTEDEIQSAINLARDICASAPDNFADIVSDIWALIDSKKEQMRAAYKHVTNNLMKFEQIEQLDGVNPKLKGGYYPIHRMYLTKTQDDLFSQNFRDTTAMSTVSSLKDRGDATATDLSLTFDGLNQWVETTERYSNVAVPYYELASFFNQQKVAEALGKDYSKVVSDWMQNADRPLKTLSVIKTLNVLTDVKVLGFSPIKMMRQYSGILFAAGDVGYRNVLQSFGEYMTDANRLMHPIEEAQKLSPYMRDRYSNYAKTVLGGEAVARESQKGVVWSTLDKALDKVSPVALCLLTMADAQASTIVWEAQYDKSILAGKTHAEAVFDADSVVMRTQGDASSYSRPEIMRGEMRFFMKYMTYFTSVYSSLFSNRMYGNNSAERMKFAITLANATIICTLYESVINTIPQLWSDDDDDDETFYRKWMNEIGSTAGNVMLPLFGLGQTAGRVLTGQRVYAPSFVPLTPVYNFYQKATSVMNKDDKEMADYVDLIMTASPIPKDISRWVTEELR